MLGYMSYKLESRQVGEISASFSYAEDTTLMAESEEELKSLLMRMKEESKRASLKLNITKTKIMASGLITSQQIEEVTVEAVTDSLLFGSKVTIDSDCSLEIKRRLLLGRKAMTNLDSVLKNKDITLLTKGHVVKAVVSSVVTYICESWNIKKAECQRFDAFELWCWRRLLKVPWTARRSNKSILREINPKYLPEGLTLKMNLQYFGLLMQAADLLGKSLMLGKIEGRKRRGHQRVRWLDGITDAMDINWANSRRW